MAEHVAHSGRVELDVCTQFWSEESGCERIIGVDGRIILKWTLEK
jgi:hypothetical protein